MAWWQARRYSLLGDLDRETHVFGLAVACGIVPKTGIAGLTLGGGVGWLLRKHGMGNRHLHRKSDRPEILPVRYDIADFQRSHQDVGQ